MNPQSKKGKSQPTSANGLSMGKARSVLPQVLERTVFDFLSLNEVGECMFFLSKGFADSVARYLSTLKVLHCDFLYSCATARPSGKVGFALAEKHCRSLQRIQAVDSRSELDDSRFFGPFEATLLWIRRIIYHNRQSLRTVSFPHPVSKDEAKELLQCPLLEELNLTADHVAQTLTKALLTRVTASHLPHVTELSLSVSTGDSDCPVPRHALSALLQTPFALKTLKLRGATFEDCIALAAPHYAGLQRLFVTFDRNQHLVTDIAPSFEKASKVLCGLALTHVHLHLPQFTMNAPLLQSAVWSFRDTLVSLKLDATARAITALPRIHSPNLKLLHITDVVGDLFDFVVAMCMEHRQLDDLRLRFGLATFWFKGPLSAKPLIAALHDGAWPSLTSFDLCFGSSDTPQICAALCEKPRPLRNLQLVSGRSISAAAVRQLVCSHPTLQQLTVYPPRVERDQFGAAHEDFGDDLDEGQDEERTASESEADAKHTQSALSALTNSSLQRFRIQFFNDNLFLRANFSDLKALMIGCQEERPCMISSLRVVLDACPSLTALVLSRVPEFALPPTSFSFSGLRVLNLSHISWLTQPKTRQLLCAFPNVRVLWLFESVEFIVSVANDGALRKLETLYLKLPNFSSKTVQQHAKQLAAALPAIQLVVFRVAPEKEGHLEKMVKKFNAKIAAMTDGERDSLPNMIMLDEDM